MTCNKIIAISNILHDEIDQSNLCTQIFLVKSYWMWCVSVQHNRMICIGIWLSFVLCTHRHVFQRAYIFSDDHLHMQFILANSVCMFIDKIRLSFQSYNEYKLICNQLTNSKLVIIFHTVYSSRSCHLMYTVDINRIVFIVGLTLNIC